MTAGPHPSSPPTLPREAAALEALGHLKNKVCLMWGTPELDVFISRLIMDSRDGQRQGLPMQVGAELLFLAQINKLIRAIDLLSTQKLTLKEAYRIIDIGDQKRLEADAFDNPLVSRDTVVKARNEEYQAKRQSRAARPEAEGPIARLGQMVFGLVFSKTALILIGVALTAKLLWPYIPKLVG